MDCFGAEIVSDDLVVTEHAAARWLTKLAGVPSIHRMTIDRQMKRGNNINRIKVMWYSRSLI